MPQSSFLPPPTSAEILVGAANPYHAACTRRVSAAGLAPTSGEVVMEFQSDSARTDSPVRVLNAQPASPVSARYVWLAKVPAIFSGLSETRRGLYGAIFSISSGGWSFSRASLRSPTFNIRGVTTETRFEVARDRFDMSTLPPVVHLPHHWRAGSIISHVLLGGLHHHYVRV
jgi:hypothetical protein